MNSLRDFIQQEVDPDVRFETTTEFVIKMPFEEYISRAREIVCLLENKLGERYLSEYDFNVKHARFFPDKI